jgi:hypothetical protein
MCITVCIRRYVKLKSSSSIPRRQDRRPSLFSCSHVIATCCYHVIFPFMLELLIRSFLYGDVINIILCKYKNYGSMNSQYLYLFLLCIKFNLNPNLSLLTRRHVASTVSPSSDSSTPSGTYFSSHL